MNDPPAVTIARINPGQRPRCWTVRVRTADQGAPPEELLSELAHRYEPYASEVHRSGQDTLRFCADKADLDKWSLGRLNREALIAWLDHLTSGQGAPFTKV